MPWHIDAPRRAIASTPTPAPRARHRPNDMQFFKPTEEQYRSAP
jgi:hypothetical protein